MLVKELNKRPASRMSLQEQARALGVVLRAEFEVAFEFYSLATGEKLAAPAAGGFQLSPAEVHSLAAIGEASVTPLSDKSYRVCLLMFHAGEATLLAVGEMEGIAADSTHSLREMKRLQKWLQSIADRLRLADREASGRGKRDEQNRKSAVAWEAILGMDQLLRHLRLYKDPDKNQRQILEAGRLLLNAKHVAWIPRSTQEPVRLVGEGLLKPDECRTIINHLAPSLDGNPAEPVLCNDIRQRSWGEPFPHVANLIAYTVIEKGTLGYILALNKTSAPTAPPANGASSFSVLADGSSFIAEDFRHTDAALLMPFIGLLKLQTRTYARHRDLKDLLVGLTRSLTAAMDAKDVYTYGHSERVARIAVELGRELKMDGDELSDIYLAGLLHDIGNIGVHDAILGKKEPLTPEEYEHIKQHVSIGYAILADLGPIRHLLQGVLYHHERWDGTGYPDRLAGESIPKLARILAVADSYDAMCTSRPYREAMPCRRVEEILVQGAGTQWDKEVVDAFMRCRLKIHAIRQRGVGESLRTALESALNRKNDSVTQRSIVG